MRKRTRPFDNPFLIGVSAVLVFLLLNAAVFNVPLIPFGSAEGKTVSLGIGVFGTFLLAFLLMMLFVRRQGK